MSSKEVAQKCKQFVWISKMVGDLPACLQAFRTKVAFEGLDFDEARAQAQYRELRKEIVKIYEDGVFTTKIELVENTRLKS